MSENITAATGPFDLTKIGPFTEDEMTAMLQALFRKINTELRTSGPAPKRPFIDCFGIQKSYKTSSTTEMEKIFRRNGYKIYCPPESAEHEDVRAEVADDLIVYQLKHLNVVMDQFLNLTRSRDYHAAIVSRGLIDMLYWYEKGSRKGIYSQVHVQSVKNFVYEVLKQDLVDVFLYFTCSVEAAIKREYGQAVTQKRGSKMNETDIAKALDIYETVQKELALNVPGLPIFHIDTTEMNVRQAAEEALRFILPTLCVRHEVPDYSFMPYALSLVQRRAQHSEHFEEQLKLYGHPKIKKIIDQGWIKTKENNQRDIYLNPGKNSPINPWGEVLRLRWEDEICKFLYKGTSRDRILSHRQPYSFNVEQSEAENILKSYEIAMILTKNRMSFRKDGLSDDKHFFSLHVDSIDGLGKFTEIRARGTDSNMHTKELLALAENLGFKTSDIANGNYLSMALTHKRL